MPPSTTKNKTLQERKKQMPNCNLLLLYSELYQLRGIIRSGKLPRINTKTIRKISLFKTYKDEIWKQKDST